MEVGEREIINISLHCHHQNDFCIKVGSDESHFNVSLIVRDKVTRQCPPVSDDVVGLYVHTCLADISGTTSRVSSSSISMLLYIQRDHNY